MGMISKVNSYKRLWYETAKQDDYTVTSITNSNSRYISNAIIKKKQLCHSYTNSFTASLIGMQEKVYVVPVPLW